MISGLVLARYLIHDQFANQGIVDFVIPYARRSSPLACWPSGRRC